MDPSAAVSNGPAVECVVLIGLPGAGKTTFYQSYFTSTHRHISKDLWPAARRRDLRQERELAAALARGESVVVDNTNATRADRARIVSAARARQSRVVGYFFDVTTREAVSRNAQREGRARVSNVAVFTVAKRLERPTLDEGFDQLFRIVLTPDHGFSITEMQPV